MLSTTNVIIQNKHNQILLKDIEVDDVVLGFNNQYKLVKEVQKRSYPGQFFAFSISDYVFDDLNSTFHLYLMGVAPQILPIGDKYMLTYYVYQNGFEQKKLQFKTSEEAQEYLTKNKFLDDEQIITLTLFDIMDLKNGNEIGRSVYNHKLRIPTYCKFNQKYIPGKRINLNVTLISNPTFIVLN